METLLALSTVALALVTWWLANSTHRTIDFLQTAQDHQARELKNQTAQLIKQTEQLNAQTRALTISAEHFVTTELLTMGRWLAENSDFDEAMRRPESEHSAQGESAALVLSGFMDQILRHSRLMGQGNEKLWIPYIRDRLVKYPQVRKRIIDHPELYDSAELVELAKEVSEPPERAS